MTSSSPNADDAAKSCSMVDTAYAGSFIGRFTTSLQNTRPRPMKRGVLRIRICVAFAGQPDAHLQVFGIVPASAPPRVPPFALPSSSCGTDRWLLVWGEQWKPEADAFKAPRQLLVRRHPQRPRGRTQTAERGMRDDRIGDLA